MYSTQLNMVGKLCLADIASWVKLSVLKKKSAFIVCNCTEKPTLALGEILNCFDQEANWYLFSLVWNKVTFVRYSFRINLTVTVKFLRFFLREVGRSAISSPSQT